jgi:hypothetical protein
MRPAGGAVNLDPTNRKPTVDDGKNRLFGLSDENAMPSGHQQMQSKNTGKKILHTSANSYQNVIGGSYGAEGGYDGQPANHKIGAKYMSGPGGIGVNPITSHNVDQYYPDMMANNRPY